MSSVNERKTLLFFCALNFFDGSNYWTVLQISSALPGEKTSAGLSYGFAELIGSIAAGMLLKYVKDTRLKTACMICTVLAQSVFYFVCGGVFSSKLSIVCNFMSVFGVAVSWCCIFYMIERRIPPEKLGNAYNKTFSAYSMGAIMGTYMSYLPQPAPFIMLAGGSVLNILLVKLMTNGERRQHLEGDNKCKVNKLNDDSANMGNFMSV